jgi:hypothetical protein
MLAGGVGMSSSDDVPLQDEETGHLPSGGAVVRQTLSRAEVAAWLRKEARGPTTPHVQRVLLRLAKHVEGGAVLLEPR